MKKTNLIICGIALVMMTSTVGLAGLNDGLVTYYSFNGNANDLGSNGNHGTVLGATLTQDMYGGANGAYYFDGVNDYILASANNLPTGERTVSLWFNADIVSTRPGLLGYGGNGGPPGTSWLMSIWYQSETPVVAASSHWNTNAITYYSYSDPLVGAWYNLTVTTATGPGGAEAIYLNGDLKASNNNFTQNTYVNGKDLAIGAVVSTTGIAPYTDSNVRYYKGIIDDVRIYDRALSTGEIRELYDLQVLPVPAPGAALLGMLGLGAAGIKLRKYA